ncbi:MAG TPA: flagellar biosynthesis anti-sigma factor FlgM [Candidatus Deferrimicrobiaceae bacterium]
MKESDRGKWDALFAEAHRAVDVLSATRLRRIEEIRAALDAGAYRVDGRLVAEKMVSDVVRELRQRIR